MKNMHHIIISHCSTAPHVLEPSYGGVYLNHIIDGVQVQCLL